MSIVRFRLGFILLLLLSLLISARGSVVYTYDFPGTPGSGLVANQSSSVPAYSTFGDWTRNGVIAGTTANVFDSTHWNTSSTFDFTEYESFSITSDAGWHLNLNLLTFDQMRTSGGSTKGRVQMFINGSGTPYATLNFNPGASFKNETFNFTPTTDADNATSVEFRFYAWNGGSSSASLLLDNVAVTVTVVPEGDCGAIAVFFVLLMAASSTIRARRQTRIPAGPGQRGC